MSRRRGVLPPEYFLLGVALVVGLSRVQPAPVLGPVARWVAMVPFAAGMTLFVWTVRMFRRSGTELRPLQEPGTLMTGGPFRVSRNPIYLGFTLVLLAVVLFDGPAIALPVPFLYALVIQKQYIEKEEAFLTEHFGDAYRAYRARVRRWL